MQLNDFNVSFFRWFNSHSHKSNLIYSSTINQTVYVSKNIKISSSPDPPASFRSLHSSDPQGNSWRELWRTSAVDQPARTQRFPLSKTTGRGLEHRWFDPILIIAITKIFNPPITYYYLSELFIFKGCDESAADEEDEGEEEEFDWQVEQQVYQENSEEELKAMQTYGFGNLRSGVFARLQVSQCVL